MSNSILPAAGNLDIVNANVRADKFNAATNIGVANTSVTDTFSVGTKFHIDKDSIDPVSVTGNVVASGIKISNLTIGPAFDFASVSNVGNVTANVIQFANATTGFTTTANVEIGGNISLTSNAQVKVGSNVLTEYTGPHPREPKELPLKKYPEIVFEEGKFDKNYTTNTYTQAGYTVTTDGENPDTPVYHAFDNQVFNDTGDDLNRWQTLNHGYYGSTSDTTTGPVTTLANGTTKRGSYIQLESPHKIAVSKYLIWAQSNSDTFKPKKVILLGSNTGGTDWVSIDPAGEVEPEYVGTGAGTLTSIVATVSFTNTTPYKYHRLVVRANYGATVLLVQELELYGREESSETVGDLSLDTTLKSTFNSVRSNNYVMYFDGKDPQGSPVVPKNLVNTISITPNHATFDATNNCWSLSGNIESNVTTADLGFEGDAPHTVSMWLNASNLNNNVHSTKLFSLADDFSLSLNNDKHINDFDFYLASNTWTNITYTNEGRSGYRTLYCNGEEVAKKQNEDTHGLYPPIPIIDDEGVDGYMITASSVGYSDENEDYPAWEAFNQSYATNHSDFWCSQEGVGLYNSSGNYTGTVDGRIARNLSKMHNGDGTGVADGEWIMMEAPYKLCIYGVYLRARSSHESRAPGNFIVYGSNDPTSGNWDVIFTVTGATPSAGNSETNGLVGGTNYPGADETSTVYGAGKGKGYRFIALVTTKTAGNPSGDQCVMIAECAYYGHREGDLTRFPEPTKVLKYPHISMTGSAQRGYVVTTNSELAESTAAWKAFDGNDGVHWQTANNSFGTSGDFSAVSGQTFAGYTGHWIKLELPHKIELTRFKIKQFNHANQQPKDYVLLGSNNDSSWTLIHAETAANMPGGVGLGTEDVTSFSAGTPAAYKYIKLLVQKLEGSSGSSAGYMTIDEIEYFGTEEDTGTPAIVGGSFDGKVANFRVYDNSLGKERIREIYDAQKDEFEHKKSSTTFYKGRIGVGTTEPEGALTVVNEAKTLERFPKRVFNNNDSYVDGQGQFHISASIRGEGYYHDNNAWQIFGGSTLDRGQRFILNPPRNTRLSQDTDSGAWVKMESPMPINVKKVEIGGVRSWIQIGDSTTSSFTGKYFGTGLGISGDGTRVAVGTIGHVGTTYIYDWAGRTGSWPTQGEQTITGDANARDGYANSFSGDGKYLAIGGPQHSSDTGRVRIFSVNDVVDTTAPTSVIVPTWTQVGSTLVGTSTSEFGFSVSLDRTGETLAVGAPNDNTTTTDGGRVSIFTRTGTTWTVRQTIAPASLLTNNQRFGRRVKLSQDGQYLIIGGPFGTNNNGLAAVYKRNADETWSLRASFTGSSGEKFGMDVAISNGGTYIAIGAPLASDSRSATMGRADAYKWNGSSYDLVFKEYNRTNEVDTFANSLDMSEDGYRLIIGAGHDDAGGSDAGRAYSYEWDGNGYNRMYPQNDFDALGSAASSYLANDNISGVRISADGSTVGLGTPHYGSNNGMFQVFGFAKSIKGVWGSNDDINWTKLTNETKIFGKEGRRSSGVIGYVNYDIDTDNYYKYHAIIGDSFTALSNTSFYGFRKQESSTLHDGNLTLTKSITVPRIGPSLDTDKTPRRDRLVAEYNTSTCPLISSANNTNIVIRDTSGRGNDAVLMNGAKYDPIERAFDVNATNSHIKSGIIPAFSGNQTHTISVWFKPGADFEGTWVEVAPYSGETTNQVTSIAYETGNTRFKLESWGNDIGSAQSVHAHKWYHLVVTYNRYGGTISVHSKKFYIDGVPQDTITISGPNALNLTNPIILLGSRVGGVSNKVEGLISNFKLYDCALTHEEVKTLYDMGRCDDGHHVVDFSKTRVGIGLGDGKISKAALDVRGDAFFRGVVSTGLPAIFGSVDNVSYVAQASRAQNITTVEYTQGPSMFRPAGGLYFPVAGMYIVHFATHCWYSGGGVIVRSQMEFRRYNSAGTIYANRGLEYDIQTGTTAGNADMHHAATFFVHANAGDYATLTHSTSPDTTRNYQNDWNYVSAACVSLDEPQYSSE